MPLRKAETKETAWNPTVLQTVDFHYCSDISLRIISYSVVKPKIDIDCRKDININL